MDTTYNFQKVLSQILFTYVFSLPAGMRKGGGEREEEELEVFFSCFLILLFLLILKVRIIYLCLKREGCIDTILMFMCLVWCLVSLKK